MATFSKLKVGQKLYFVSSQYAGNTKTRTKRVLECVVKELYPASCSALISVNGNPPGLHYNLAVFRVNKPKMVATGLGAK